MARYSGRHRPLPTRPATATQAVADRSRRRIFAPLVVVAATAGVSVGALGLVTAVKASEINAVDSRVAMVGQVHTKLDSVIALAASRAQQKVSRDVTRTAVRAIIVERADVARVRANAVAAAAAAADRAKAVAAERARVAAVEKQRTAVIAVARAKPQTAARALMVDHGWTSDQQYGCLINLWTGESGWQWSAHNASSGAYGIPQSLPASKMAQFGADYRTNPLTQMKWGLWYIKASYGSPCGAWAFWQAKSPHWY